MRIGILQTGHAPDALIGERGDYADMFQRLLVGEGFDFAVWNVVDGEFPPDVHAADGWLITGSRHATYEDHAFIPPLEEFIRKAYAEGVPIVGICFGHQIVAQALGGKVERFTGGWSVGPTRYRFGDREIVLNAWHRDQVTRRPEGAELAASAPTCENAALVYGDRAFTVQAHPEFDAEFLRGLIAARGRGLVPEPVLADAEARLSTQTLDQPVMARRIADFFRQPRS
jgi:GMP synthase-like glutamine amidotransferase